MKSKLTLAAAAVVGLVFPALAFARAGSSPQPTFNKDVAPILYKNCVACHRPGQIAPMSLVAYKDVRPWARSIREVVMERRMPPWLAEPHYGEFANDRRLSQKEIDTIAAWVETGAREGESGDLAPAPQFTEGWTIGAPDLVLAMNEEFSVPADGVVPYKYFTVPTNFTEDRYVQFAEIRQGNRAVVHHVIVTVREPGDSAGPADAPSGEDGTRRGRNPDGMLVGWAPGMSPLMLPPGKAKLIKAGSSLVFQMHYTPNGEAGRDRTSVGLTFAKGPVEKRVVTTPVAARALVIPPGEPNYESHSSYTFKEDCRILSFMPHMHVRGKDFEYRLVYPDGVSKIVLRVPRYDFNWQLSYFLKEPLAVPKGSRLECTAHHDNSAGNKYNPDPTKEVRWGPQTWEEMMIGWFDYTLDSQDLRQGSKPRTDSGSPQ
ncbi:MAG TPA: thiol-disulfide isomerase [Thermoanaerobaculia bacterium]